jgi:NADH-ubiquinone oxidoreductase chain 4L
MEKKLSFDLRKLNYKFLIFNFYSVKNNKIMNLSLLLFLIGVLGFVLNRKNIILMLISIEIMLLSITYLILINSLNFDDIVGQTFAIYIITIAGAESAIGLGILLAFYRLRGTIAIDYISSHQDHNPSMIRSVNKKDKNLGVRNFSTVRAAGGINGVPMNQYRTNNRKFTQSAADSVDFSKFFYLGALSVTIKRLSRLNYKIKYKKCTY